MMNTPKPYKRKLRNFLIYPKFQLSLLGIQSAVMAVTFGLMQIENSAAFTRLESMGSAAGLSPNHPYFQFVHGQSGTFFSHTLLVFIVGLILSSAVTLYLSFRLAGPIYRLRGYLQLIEKNGASGVAPLTFRKGDFYSDLPPIVNGALKRIQRDH